MPVKYVFSCGPVGKRTEGGEGRAHSVADEKELVGRSEVGFERLGLGRGRKTVGKEKKGARRGGTRQTHSAL